MKGRGSAHAAHNLMRASRAEQGPIKTQIAQEGVKCWKEHPRKAQQGAWEGKAEDKGREKERSRQHGWWVVKRRSR